MNQDRTALIISLSSRLMWALLLALLFILTPILIPQIPLRLTLTCFGTGMLGGFVSIQQRLRLMPVLDLSLYARSWTVTLLFPIVGGILALVLYVAFLSGIVQGHAFPNFYVPSFSQPPNRDDISMLFLLTTPNSGADFCKLFFWSFVAGFSERFVLGFLRKMSSDPEGPETTTNKTIAGD